MNVTEQCPCGEAHDNWQSEDPKAKLCQGCWEKECDASWWAAVEPLIPFMSREQQR